MNLLRGIGVGILLLCAIYLIPFLLLIGIPLLIFVIVVLVAKDYYDTEDKEKKKR